MSLTPAHLGLNLSQRLNLNQRDVRKTPTWTELAGLVLALQPCGVLSKLQPRKRCTQQQRFQWTGLPVFHIGAEDGLHCPVPVGLALHLPCPGLQFDKTIRPQDCAWASLRSPSLFPRARSTLRKHSVVGTFRHGKVCARAFRLLLLFFVFFLFFSFSSAKLPAHAVATHLCSVVIHPLRDSSLQPSTEPTSLPATGLFPTSHLSSQSTWGEHGFCSDLQSYSP